MRIGQGLVVNALEAAAPDLLRGQEFVNSTTIVRLPQMEFLELQRWLLNGRSDRRDFIKVTIARCAPKVGRRRLAYLVANGLRRLRSSSVVRNLIRYLLCLVHKIARARRVGSIEVLHYALEL